MITATDRQKPLPTVEPQVAIVGSFGSRTVRWLSEAHIGSAAFWVDQAARSTFPASMRLGQTLIEEVAVCVIGGHGITGPMTRAAFDAVRNAGLLQHNHRPTAQAIEQVLRQPLTVEGYSKPVKYRFAHQRASRLAAGIQMLHDQAPPSGLPARALRNWFTRLPGVGMKTASWITRNLTLSDDIAIIDIHVQRAGVVAEVFDPTWRLPHDYIAFEDAFCRWAQIGGVPTAQLDLCIWHQLADGARHGYARLDRSPPIRLHTGAEGTQTGRLA